jgi:hypothetical protein
VFGIGKYRKHAWVGLIQPTSHHRSENEIHPDWLHLRYGATRPRLCLRPEVVRGPNAYTVVVESARSPSVIKKCARSFIPKRSGGPSPGPPVPHDHVETAYGPSSVSSDISYLVTESGDHSLLQVSGRSWAYSANGKGEANSNRTVIPPTGDARARVDLIAIQCP